MKRAKVEKILRSIARAIMRERLVDQASVEEIWNTQPEDVHAGIQALIRFGGESAQDLISSSIRELKGAGISEEEISTGVSFYLSYFRKEEAVRKGLLSGAVHSWCEDYSCELAGLVEVDWSKEAKKRPVDFPLWEGFVRALEESVPNEKQRREILDALRPLLSAVAEDSLRKVMEETFCRK